MSFLCKEFWTQNVIVSLSPEADPVFFFQNGTCAVDRNRGVEFGYCDSCFERRKGSESSFLVVAFSQKIFIFFGDFSM